MAQLNIVYSHSTEPSGSDVRRKSVAEMEKYIEHLVMEMKFAGISVNFESVAGEGKNFVSVNGKKVEEILDGLDIKKPEVDSDTSNSKIIKFERSPEDWNEENVEDISDILMKNALSKSYADAEKLRISTLK